MYVLGIVFGLIECSLIDFGARWVRVHKRSIRHRDPLSTARQIKLHRDLKMAAVKYGFYASTTVAVPMNLQANVSSHLLQASLWHGHRNTMKVLEREKIDQ